MPAGRLFMSEQEGPPKWPRFVVKMPKVVEPPGQMSFVWELPGPRTPSNYEQRMMKLLNVKSPDELNRVLSEPPDERVLEEMESPNDLYAEDWKQDRADEAEIEHHEMETGEKDGTEAPFATKDGKVGVIWVPTPPPAELIAFRHFSRQVVLSESADLDAYNVVWSVFVRRGNLGEFLIYEET